MVKHQKVSKYYQNDCGWLSRRNRGVTWYVGWGLFILLTTLWKWRYNAFYLPRDHVIEVSLDFVGVVTSSWVTILLVLGALGRVKIEIQRFSFVKWPRDWSVLWLCRWSSVILSYHPAKSGIQKLLRKWR